jgi:UDP-N-acetylmuramyl pentapeptide synthase
MPDIIVDPAVLAEQMGDKSEEIHKQIGREIAEAGIEKVVLVRNSATPFIEVGLKEHNFAGDIIWFDTAKDCFSYLSKQTINSIIIII